MQERPLLRQSASMFLRRNRRVVDGETYEYWTLVRTVRTSPRPRQEIIATLGKEPGLESLSHQQERPESAPVRRAA